MHIKIFTKETKIFFRLLPYLAEAYYDGKRNLTLKELSELSKITLQGNILSTLVQGQIVRNVKIGTRSSLGYIFSRDPKEISAFETVQILQGIPYLKCTSEWYEKTGEVCPVCEAMGAGLEKAIEALKKLSLYDYAKVVKKEL